MASQQHAPATPQSNGSSSGNGTIEDSTVGSPEPISALQAPAAATDAEVVPHAGQANILDPYVYMQFLQVATLVWSTSMLPGTLLYSIPIHPDRGNSIVAYLTRIYNAWAGSMEFKLKIAGTGFHAGALAIVRLPPNIPPSSITTVEQFTAFEWELFDPKQLELCTRTLMDQRNIMYHYKPLDLADRQSFGGYFCIYVMMPLNTSSTGLNQINVNIWNRLGADFIVSQVIPPSIDITQAKDLDVLNSLLETSFAPRMSWNSMLVDTIRQVSSSIVVILAHAAGQTMANGEPYDPRYPLIRSAWAGLHCADGKTMVDNQGTSLVLPFKSNAADSYLTGSDALRAVYSKDSIGYPIPNPMVSAATSAPTVIQFANVSGTIPIGTYLTNPLVDDLRAIGGTIDPSVIVPKNESAVLFGCTFYVPQTDKLTSAQHHWSTQTETIALGFKTKAANIIPTGMAVMYIMTQKETGLPVNYVKLYYNGLVTMPAAAETLYGYMSYNFQQIGLVSETAQFPRALAMQMAQTRLLLNATGTL
jgi:hypothetical protein